MHFRRLNETNPDATELREFFDVTGHIESNDDKYFPEEVFGFKAAFDQVRKNCLPLTETLLRCIAIYLGLEPDTLLKRHTHLYDRTVPSQTVMRSSMYSPLKETQKVKEGAIRCGEHCDWHTITLLFQDMIGGLEVSISQKRNPLVRRNVISENISQAGKIRQTFTMI